MEDFWRRVAKDKNSIRFEQAKAFSPYSEFSKNWKEEKDGICKLTVNGFYRYDSIFEPLFSQDYIDEEKKAWLFDIYMHYLTELEYRKGLTYEVIRIREVMEELQNGFYGPKVSLMYQKLSIEDQYYIADAMIKQLQTKESIRIFSDVLVHIMRDGVVYKSKNREKELLYYINQSHEVWMEDKIEAIKELFLPLGYELEVFWEKHFAVLGFGQTMQVDEIKLL